MYFQVGLPKFDENGLIKKGKGNIVSLQDKGMQGQEAMQGQIDINLLYALLNQLIKTYKQ